MSARCWDRRRAKQRERYAWPHASTPAWIIAATRPSAALEAFTREYLGVPWSRPDADPLADMQAAHRQAELDYHRSLGAMHKTETVLDEVEIRGYAPLAVWLDEVIEVDPDA